VRQIARPSVRFADTLSSTDASSNTAVGGEMRGAWKNHAFSAPPSCVRQYAEDAQIGKCAGVAMEQVLRWNKCGKCGRGPFRSVLQEGFPLQHQHRSSSSLRSGTAFPRPKGEYQFKHILSCPILLTGLILPSPPFRPQLLKLLNVCPHRPIQSSRVRIPRDGDHHRNAHAQPGKLFSDGYFPVHRTELQRGFCA
jgi:hypothetical protein